LLGGKSYLFIEPTANIKPDCAWTEKGRVNLHNNPDVADSNAQGTLPNTDPIGVPINSDVNHQE